MELLMDIQEVTPACFIKNAKMQLTLMLGNASPLRSSAQKLHTFRAFAKEYAKV